MRYADIIQFEPIESVIELREADKDDYAKHLVETFVISDRMAEILTKLVFTQLQFKNPTDNRGLLIVGNYGTGKSHLMALISAIAEHKNLVTSLNNVSVAKEASSIAGRFKVIRHELGSTEMTLRDIVCNQLEKKLSGFNIHYEFPSAKEVDNSKDSFVEMMAAFEQVYPEQGLLLVLDELLDYLRTRKEQELILDLNFLREVGEVCKSTRFRFISGVQESLFDNLKFQFVAETLRRVKDRFEQVRIAREDVAFVVSQRLLKKTPKQRGKVREHLMTFASLYGTMNEKMEKFVELFPVHPAYLDTFEKVYVAEKREVLKTLSAAIRDILQQNIPTNKPGLIAYDSYWNNLKNNPSFRSVPDIKEVIDKSKILESRIQQAYTQPKYKNVAIRIINALSVHRLTTGSIYNSIGATAEELRDDLCLILSVPEQEAAFLKTLVEKVLKDILITVSGQFISYNKENSQYYLDLRKDVDFDSLITKKADTLDADKLDRYYFTALTRVLEASDDTFVSGYRIWEHEVEWRERKSNRSGYLFFGAPTDRSTAQPPRDFYLYFIHPNEPSKYKDEKRPDEVFFKLKHRDEDFDTHLKLFAGAIEMADTASGENKRIYKDKANGTGGHLQHLTKWLREHISTAFEVTYQGKKRTLKEVIKGKISGGGPLSVRDQVNTAAAVCLAPQFLDKSPDYPIFSYLITRKNRDDAARSAIRWVAGSVKSREGTAVLDALELLDGDQLRPRQSRYAMYILDLLDNKGEGQVLNRSELVHDEDGIDFWTRFRLEPEFLVVVLGALVHSGSLTLSITGKKFNAGNVEQLKDSLISELVNFKHIQKPKGLPIEALKELFEMLDIPKGKLINENTRHQAVNELQVKVASKVEKLVMAMHTLQSGLRFWGRTILSDQEATDWSTKLSGVKDFLEGLQAFTTPGRLNNFPHDVSTIQAQKNGLALIRSVDDLSELIAHTGSLTSYLSIAESVLPVDHPWQLEVQNTKAELLTKVTSPKFRSKSSFNRILGQKLGELKANYKTVYLEMHKHAHLGAKDDAKKAEISKDLRLKKLQQLAKVEIMSVQQLNTFQDTLFGLKTCFSLSSQDIEHDPICPYTGYRPVENPPGVLSASEVLAKLDDQLNTLVSDWTLTLLSNLDDPTVAANIELISNPTGKKEILAFMENRELPDSISDSLVLALRNALTGLQKVGIDQNNLRDALTNGGMPCTIDELKSRFDTYVSGLTKGKDSKKVRVVIK